MMIEIIKDYTWKISCFALNSNGHVWMHTSKPFCSEFHVDGETKLQVGCARFGLDPQVSKFKSIKITTIYLEEL